MDRSLHPILTCAEAKRFEAARFGGSEENEWRAMSIAGRALAAAVALDCQEIGGLSGGARALVLAGKGHNGGDAIIAAGELVRRYPGLRVDVWLAFSERTMRPLALRAWRDLVQSAGEVVSLVDEARVASGYDLVIDGLFGHSFRPPLDARATAILSRVNALEARLRVAVDLPSGLSEPGAFRADITYATGIPKEPLLETKGAGRLRFLDLGFDAAAAFPAARSWVVDATVLAPLAGLRPADSDKRSYGHLFVVGGSGSYPGAVLMAVLAAVRSGVGLVTAFVPASLVPAFAARVPEAMWVGWPETPNGNLAMEGSHLLRERIGRASALLIGPGMGRELETLALALDLARTSPVPLVLDADALQPDIVQATRGPAILTPHAGEFDRIAGGRDVERFSESRGVVTVLKGPVTRIADGRTVVCSFFGGPVLARGGSGDLLAGLIGGLLAQTPGDPRTAAIRGVAWHGRAADLLAREHGATAVRTTAVLDFLPTALRPSQ